MNLLGARIEPEKDYTPVPPPGFNLDKEPLAEGCLEAIKGQYLILDSGVINIRKYGGYLVSLECG